MRIIHCSDIHLDSPFSARFTKAQAREERALLLQAFLRMIDWAGENGVRAILLCGDIFDSEGISGKTLRAVQNAVVRSRGVLFFYLCGNHDPHCPLFSEEDPPPNFFVFGREWSTYTLQEENGGLPVRITGLSYTGRPLEPLLTRLSLPPSCVNLVLLHGTASAGGQKEEPDLSIPLSALRGKGIDYLALGHIHSYSEGRIDGRGIYVCPGCLQGRGFDECGPKGFVLLETDGEGRLSRRFVPSPLSTVYSLRADCTGCTDTWEIAGRVRECMQQSGCTGRDLVRVTLTGELAADLFPDYALLQKEGELLCRIFVLQDETSCRPGDSPYAGDISLKGEFVRTVLADQELPEEMKSRIIRCGLRALAGEMGGQQEHL